MTGPFPAYRHGWLGRGEVRRLGFWSSSPNANNANNAWNVNFNNGNVNNNNKNNGGYVRLVRGGK